jgi:hypothetical protein
MTIVPQHSGSWYNPAQDGHGLSVEVLDDGTVLAYWYTYTPDGGQMWVIGIGSAQGNKAVLDGLVVVGPEWGDWNPADRQQYEFGTMTLTFQSCDQLTFSYDSDLSYGDTPLGSGSMSMVRLAGMNDHKCSENPLTGIYLAGGAAKGVLGAEAGFGAAIVGPDGRFISLFGSDANGGVLVGVIEFQAGRNIRALSSAFRLNGGWIGDGLLTGEYDPGSFVLRDSTGLVAFVRDQPGSMNHPSFASGNFSIEDQYTGARGSLTVSKGKVTGNLFGCAISGDAVIPDPNFDQVFFELNLAGCSESGSLQGAGAAEVIMLYGGNTGYVWVSN